MSQSDQPELTPARPPGVKPTPARRLSGEAASPPPDLPQTEIEVGGESWRVEVIGRSGGTSGRATSLLLLGFWKDDGSGEHAREALIPGASLSELSEETLRAALESAVEPPDPDHRKPFFAEAAQTKRR